MALRAPDATYRETKASRHRHTIDFRIYNKLSQASRGFPKKVSLSITRNVGLVAKQVGSLLEKEAYVPEHQFVEEADGIPTAEAALAPLPPELQPVPIDDNLPQGNSDEAIQEFDSDYDSIDCFNSGLEDFDPAQDSTNYSPSSDEMLEPRNAFGLGESSVFLKTPLSGQLQPNEDRHETAEGTIQYFDQVDSSDSRRNPSTGEEPSIHEPELAPGLLIYSLTTPASASQNPKAAFLAMTARYAFLTSVAEYRGFTAYKHRDPGSRWLVVQEFSQNDDFDPA